ncbi:hypothetical protein CYJ76_11340 [Kytococcus schroeteri]|uniref:Nucleotidyl transferase AbiEii/AbiGii toxin family protein n=2 Tax=Kytococcus schroeteri TaxID=138300 RepID=A0A2I1P836_9MICO|nr:hypothetical protein CYJ76_11340 [Kytococcus schroeteri]
MPGTSTPTPKHPRSTPKSREWILLGGNALLVRLQGGRFPQDVDLAHAPADRTPAELLADLRLRVAHDIGDGFTLELLDITTHDHTDEFGYGTVAHKIRARALSSGLHFESFPIDVTQRRHVEGPVDRRALHPVIDDPALANLPEVPLVPLENHMADKACGLYERHKNDSASTRWRDLADLARITSALEVDAARLARMLAHEAERRRLTLPAHMVSPGPRWPDEYPRNAAAFAELPANRHSLDASLTAVGASLNPVLDDTRTTGTWEPERQRWEDPA